MGRLQCYCTQFVTTSGLFSANNETSMFETLCPRSCVRLCLQSLCALLQYRLVPCTCACTVGNRGRAKAHSTTVFLFSPAFVTRAPASPTHANLFTVFLHVNRVSKLGNRVWAEFLRNCAWVSSFSPKGYQRGSPKGYQRGQQHQGANDGMLSTSHGA